MPEKPLILNHAIVARSRLFTVEALQLQFSNGEVRDYERLIRTRSRGAVLIVPMLDDETVLLIKEYSAGLNRYEIALPKGRIEGDETILQAANRELKEEIGYGAQQLQCLINLSITPSYQEHTLDVVIAQQLYAEKLTGDEPEDLEIIPWKINNIKDLLATGTCTEASSIAALYLAYEYLHA